MDHPRDLSECTDLKREKEPEVGGTDIRHTVGVLLVAVLRTRSKLTCANEDGVWRIRQVGGALDYLKDLGNKLNLGKPRLLTATKSSSLHLSPPRRTHIEPGQNLVPVRVFCG